MTYLLSILIFLPIAGSLIVAFAPLRNSAYKYMALAVSMIQLFIAVIIYIDFKNLGGNYSIENFQFVENVKWFELSLAGYGKISANYLIGIDGLGLAMVLLSVLVLLISVISSWSITDRAKGYFALLLLLNGAIIGCFVALDFLLFYLFFEFMLLPMYFLIGLWGGPRREYASIKFFLYTLLGSILILIVMIALNISTIDPASTALELNLISDLSEFDPSVLVQVHERLKEGLLNVDQIVHSFSLIDMTNPANIIPGSLLDNNAARIVLGLPARMLAFLLVFLGFAIKVPVVPLHTWLPDAHVEAPTAISVILAGILLKVGGYGLIRAGVLIFPDGAIHYSYLLGLLGVISIIYGGLNAMASKDLKRLIAYSSVSHMGFVLLGIAAITAEALSGSIYQMVSHGLISAGLFLIAGVIYDRVHDRMIENYSGLAQKMPKYTVIVVIFFFASLGLPGFSGFMAEIFVLLGSFASDYIPGWMMVAATFGLIISAAYYLWTIQRMFYGPFHVKLKGEFKLYDLTVRELLMFMPLVILILVLGIFPHFIFDVINHSVLSMIDLIETIGNQTLNSTR